MRLVLPRRSSATADTITLGFVNTNGRAGGTTQPLLTATISISEAPLTAASQLIEGTTYYMTIMEGETEFLCTKTYSEAGFKPCTFKQAFPSPFNPFDGDNLVLPLPTDFEGCSTAEVEILTTEGVSKGALRLPIRFVGECPGAIWDGILPGGNTITNGVYLYVIRCGESTGVGKFAVIRR